MNQTKLSDIKGIGPTRLEALRAVGIVSLRDLLYFLPARYEDRTTATPCREARAGEVMVQGVIQQKPGFNAFGGLTRVTCSISDGSGRLSVVWFNQPWMREQVPVGVPVSLYGRVAEKNGSRTLQNPAVVEKPEILPVYRAPKGFPAKTFRELMRRALETVDDCCPETLPRPLRLRHGLCELNYAIRQSHFPDSFEDLKTARRRMAFEQMLLFQAALGLMRNAGEEGIPLPLDEAAAERYWQSMPFSPTGAQRRVLEQIAADLRRPRAMSRLVQGDVGCGKTALAFGAIALTCGCGYQAAMMAPTDILARQHYESARHLLEPMGITCGLLVGAMKAKEKREAHEALAEGRWQAVFGTHALITEKVAYQKLALAVTDEQHRFGVRQRTTLQEKGKQGDLPAPHVLVMSATPIPRTLSLILYGDLDVSVVDELPPGRTPVKTWLVPPEKRGDMYAFLRRKTAEGRQAYIVCPLVEDGEDADSAQDVRSARATWEELTQGELKGLRVGLTWGSQKAEEKARVLEDFHAGLLDALVSTTVIEVGVNVPNATVMVVENAERFGLSQLHQLRGRVGRGSEESWCFLMGPHTEKLDILTRTSDGFVVAQKDLELRGPGDLMGTRQSGEALQGFLLDGDVRLMEEATGCMRRLREDPAFAQEREAVEKQALEQYGEKIRQIARN